MKVNFSRVTCRCDSLIARLAQDVRSVSAANQLEADRLKQNAESNKSKTEQIEREVIVSW